MRSRPPITRVEFPFEPWTRQAWAFIHKTKKFVMREFRPDSIAQINAERVGADDHQRHRELRPRVKELHAAADDHPRGNDEANRQRQPDSHRKPRRRDMKKKADRHHRQPCRAAGFDDRSDFAPADVAVKSHRARDQNPHRHQHQHARERFTPTARLKRIQIASSDHLRQCRGADDCDRVGRRQQRLLTL